MMTCELANFNHQPASKIWKRKFRLVLPCTRYFPKSRLNTTFQMVINRTNLVLWSVFHIEALWKGEHLDKISALLEIPAAPLA